MKITAAVLFLAAIIFAVLWVVENVSHGSTSEQLTDTRTRIAETRTKLSDTEAEYKASEVEYDKVLQIVAGAEADQKCLATARELVKTINDRDATAVARMKSDLSRHCY